MGGYLLVVLLFCCCCCCCCSCTSRCVFLLVAQLGLAVCKILPTHWRWPFQDLKATFLLRKQLQNVAWSQWLVHLCVINLICIALMHFCFNMLGRSMGHISFYPQAIRTNHLSRLLRCKDAFKEPCLFLRPYGSLCNSSGKTRLDHQHLLWFPGFSGRNRNRQSMLHHSSSP